MRNNRITLVRDIFQLFTHVLIVCYRYDVLDF
jgi:hypothetical protein